MRLTAAILLAFATARAEMPVRYVLAGRVLVADPAPDPRFDVQSMAGGEFRSRFESAFSGQVLELGPDRMISPVSASAKILIVPNENSPTPDKG